MSTRFFLPNPADATYEFEEDWEIVQWTAEGEATITKTRYQNDDDHPSCMKVTSDTNNKGVYIELTDQDPSTKYFFEMAYKNDGSQQISYKIYDLINAIDISTGDLDGTIWTNHYEEFTTPAGCLTVRIYLRAKTGGADAFYVDDLKCHGNAIDIDPDSVSTEETMIGSQDMNIAGKSISDETIVVPEFAFSFPKLTKAQLDRLREFRKSRRATVFDDQVVPSMTETFQIWTATTYNFVGITNPSSTHKGWVTLSSSDPSASSDFEDTEISTADYQAIDGDDDNNVQDSASGTGDYVYHKFRFLVTEYTAADQVRNISVIVKATGDDGSSESQDGAAMYVWNNVGARWFNASNSRSPDKETLSFSTSKPEQANWFVDTTNGYIWVLLQTQNTKAVGQSLSLTSYWIQVIVNKGLGTTVSLLNKAILSGGDVISVENLSQGTTLVLDTNYTIGDARDTIIIAGQSAGDYIRAKYNQYYPVRCTRLRHVKGYGAGRPTGDAAAPISAVEMNLRSTVGLK